MTALELTIPAPCDWLNSNQRLHWTEKARRTRIWRYTAHGAALVQAKGVRFDVPVHITMTIHKTRAGRYDVANYGVTASALTLAVTLVSMLLCRVWSAPDRTEISALRAEAVALDARSETRFVTWDSAMFGMSEASREEPAVTRPFAS